MRPRPRPRITFPQGTVEAFEPANFERVTSIRSQMEVDFWKHIQMPLKSGLAAEVRFFGFFFVVFRKWFSNKKKRWFQASSALNLLLVLSRDDCTLPQLRLSQLNGLLSSLLSHLRAVLEALFPEKCPSIGSKRSIKSSNQRPTENEKNIYKINFKKVSF